MISWHGNAGECKFEWQFLGFSLNWLVDCMQHHSSRHGVPQRFVRMKARSDWF